MYSFPEAILRQVRQSILHGQSLRTSSTSGCMHLHLTGFPTDLAVTVQLATVVSHSCAMRTADCGARPLTDVLHGTQSAISPHISGCRGTMTGLVPEPRECTVGVAFQFSLQVCLSSPFHLLCQLFGSGVFGLSLAGLGGGIPRLGPLLLALGVTAKA